VLVGVVGAVGVGSVDVVDVVVLLTDWLVGRVCQYLDAKGKLNQNAIGMLNPEAL
jgi:predicted ATPase